MLFAREIRATWVRRLGQRTRPRFMRARRSPRLVTPAARKGTEFARERPSRITIPRLRARRSIEERGWGAASRFALGPPLSALSAAGGSRCTGEILKPHRHA